MVENEWNKLNEIFCKVFDDNDIKINENTTANDIDEWDSLSHINLIVFIEKSFNITFSSLESQSFKNVGELHNCIIAKLNAKEHIIADNDKPKVGFISRIKSFYKNNVNN
jgi:acyl carrier protein